MTRYNFVLLIASLVLLSTASLAEKACKRDATYELTFKYLWSGMYNFSDVPRDAHFSPLVAFSHSGRYPAFAKYGVASDGVKLVAETGATSIIESELRSAMEMGQVKDIQIDNAIPDGDGMATVVLTVNCSFPFISAITMVAPSPDWIVPLFREPLLKRKNMMRYKKITMGQIAVWDAGTDSGMNLTSANMPSDPIENIAPLEAHPFYSMPIANYTITKIKRNQQVIMV